MILYKDFKIRLIENIYEIVHKVLNLDIYCGLIISFFIFISPNMFESPDLVRLLLSENCKAARWMDSSRGSASRTRPTGGSWSSS